MVVAHTPSCRPRGGSPAGVRRVTGAARLAHRQSLDKRSTFLGVELVGRQEARVAQLAELADLFEHVGVWRRRLRGGRIGRRGGRGRRKDREVKGASADRRRGHATDAPPFDLPVVVLDAHRVGLSWLIRGGSRPHWPGGLSVDDLLLGLSPLDGAQRPAHPIAMALSDMPATGDGSATRTSDRVRANDRLALSNRLSTRSPTTLGMSSSEPARPSGASIPASDATRSSTQRHLFAARTTTRSRSSIAGSAGVPAARARLLRGREQVTRAARAARRPA